MGQEPTSNLFNRWFKKDTKTPIKKVYASKIEPMPKRSFPAKAIEFVTGIPTDLDFYRNASKQDILMSTVPQLASTVMGGMAHRITNPIKGLTTNVIKSDPFGLREGPMDRRVFLDKLIGNTTKRAQNESDRLFKSPEYLNSTEGFEKAANFAEQFNNKYGWPSAVINPEQMGKARWIPPGEKSDPTKFFEDSGIISKLYGIVKKELTNRAK